MSELRASFETFHAMQDVPNLPRQAFRYKKSLESLQVVGGLINQEQPAQVAAFDQLVKGAASEGGLSVPEDAVGDVTASMEFIGKIVKGIGNILRSNHPKPGEHLGDKGWWTKEYKAAVVQLEDAIKKYYLNDSWLKKQTFVEGNVSGDGISPALTLGDKTYPGVEEALAAQKVVYDSYIPKYQAALDKWWAEIRKHDQEINKDLFNVDDLDERLKKVLKELNALPTPPVMSGLVGKSFDLLGGYVVTFGKDQVVLKEGGQAKAVEMPALDAAGVKKAAQLILNLLAWKSDLNKYFPDVRYGGGVYNDDGEPSREFYDESAYMDDYYNLVDFHAFSDTWLDGLDNDYLIKEKMIAALDRWIDRSIK